jgi:hypothetical protein
LLQLLAMSMLAWPTQSIGAPEQKAAAAMAPPEEPATLVLAGWMTPCATST